MILTTHALAGAIIGKEVENPFWIVVFSLITHFFMDSFRHGEYLDEKKATIKNTWWKIALDLSAAFLIVFSLTYFKDFSPEKSRNILLGSFASMFPDLITAIYWLFPTRIFRKIIRFHFFCHRYGKYPKDARERHWNLRNARNDILISAAVIIMIIIGTN
ncbi:MAG: hypothetical protein HGB08_00945 [Candidatus Moranbacteria bacterium]|nr:hypothetical protein [Candidatus Moranbacteria bacterium]